MIGDDLREHCSSGAMNEIVLPLPSRAEAPPVTSPGATADAGAASRAARFRKLVDANFDFIWRSLRGLGVPVHSVDDAAQQVFLIAAQKLDDIIVGSERAFLFSTAGGVAANARRAQARRREIPDDEVLGRQVDGSPSVEKLVEMKEQRALLDQVLANMPDDLRTVFVLFVLEGIPTPEIAELLDLPQGTVASRLRRAREAFHAQSKRLQARSEKQGGPR